MKYAFFCVISKHSGRQALIIVLFLHIPRSSLLLIEADYNRAFYEITVLGPSKLLDYRNSRAAA